MEVKFYTSTREYNEKKSEFDAAVLGLMERGISMLGTEVTNFEESVKEFTGAKYAIGVASEQRNKEQSAYVYKNER